MDHPEIPTGDYCYEIEFTTYGPKTPETALLAQIFGSEDLGMPEHTMRVCPYWGVDHSRPCAPNGNGYCTLLGIKDWETKGTMLFDQIKACGINTRPT